VIASKFSAVTHSNRKIEKEEETPKSFCCHSAEKSFMSFLPWMNKVGGKCLLASFGVA
jgi:hypothetical protein